jgi:hypothetical protein
MLFTQAVISLVWYLKENYTFTGANEFMAMILTTCKK